MEDLGKEVDEYFAKKYPLETKKLLCHQCGGAVANSTQQLKAEIAALATELQDFNDRRVSAFGRVTEIVAKMRQLSAV